MLINYKKEGCTCLTDCPNLQPKQYKYKEVKTAVGSIECQKCRYFNGIDKKNFVVDCGFRESVK